MRSRDRYPISEVAVLRSQIATSSRNVAPSPLLSFAEEASLKELGYGG